MRRASKDGTAIAFTRAGDGPPLILIDGALCYRGVGPNHRLAVRLCTSFSVITYDRRGRGESDDSTPYAVAREVEDLAALIDAAGGSAYLYGISSGGELALEAARRLPGVPKVAVYEIPFVVDDTRPPVSDGFAEQLEQLLAADRPGAAVKLFMREAVRLPGLLVTAMPLFRSAWAKNKAVAHTLPYDAAIMAGLQRGEPLPGDRYAGVTVPTLVASGARSPAWVRHGAAQLADVLPSAQHRTLDGQRHYVKADAIAPLLTAFFTEPANGHASSSRLGASTPTPRS